MADSLTISIRLETAPWWQWPLVIPVNLMRRRRWLATRRGDRLGWLIAWIYMSPMRIYAGDKAVKW